jgi:circadian clock protein KaiC
VSGHPHDEEERVRLETSDQQGRIHRFETGVPGLDDVLLGGFFRGGANLILGPPGIGKTILGAQIAFHHARTGGRAVYLTVLTEPHDRLIDHLRSLRFFEERLIPDSLYFVNGYRELERGGLPAFLEVVKSTIHEHRASVVVIDGASVFSGLTSRPPDLQKFVYELNAHLSSAGCTGFLLSTGGRPVAEEAMVEAMVESITVLQARIVALRSVAELRVTKLRGSDFLNGSHHFTVTSGGVTVFPRTEAVAARRFARATPVAGEANDPDRQRAAFGIRELDKMLRGGIHAGTTTTLLGAPGSGKTLLGTSFLVHGASRGERGLFFGFFESPNLLAAKAAGVGLDVAQHARAGALAIAWQPPVEQLLDALAVRLLDAVRRQRATRVFIDGMDGFRQVAADPERLHAFFVALGGELRALGATTLLSEEMDLFHPEVLVPLQGLSATIDNLIFLRSVELRAQLRRLLAIVKLRESAHDTSLREFRITERGFAFEKTFESAEAVMTGVAREALGLDVAFAPRSSPGERPRRPPARRRRP